MAKKDATATTSEETKPKIDPARLRRKKEEVAEPGDKPEEVRVSSAAVDKALDLAFAPSREMLPSVTVIDKFQGRLFPLIDVINVIWEDVISIAVYRQDRDEYKRVFKKARPTTSNWLDELLHRTALWQKSIGGINLTKITDIALAEMESRSEEGEEAGGVDAWGKE